MSDTRIRTRQKKILFIVGIVLAAFIIFLAFIYLPSRRELNKARKELKSAELELETIKTLTGKDVPLEKAIVLLKERLDNLDKKFPEKEEIILRDLSALAAKMDIKLMSMRPTKKKAVESINGLPVNIKGCFVQEMQVSMDMQTSYKRLGEFFRVLKEEFPIYVRIDKLNMTKVNEKMPGLLNVNISLDTYLICPDE